jgi:hypothetical protein
MVNCSHTKVRRCPILACIVGSVLLWATLAQSESSATRKVTVVDGKSPANFVAAHSGKSWAVVIGIDEYHDPKIPRLKYAMADVRAIGKGLEVIGTKH